MHPITNDLGDWPAFLGYNKLKVKEGAQLLATIEQDPFIVIGEFGQGRTAYFTSDCAPHWGTREFMNWHYYKEI
ncbi:MAG: glutamine amidotransferase [Solibacillus sp.]